MTSKIMHYSVFLPYDKILVHLKEFGPNFTLDLSKVLEAR
jgi:hypothetical protein